LTDAATKTADTEDKKTEDATESGPRAYVKVLSDTAKWAVAALGAAASFAVANIGLSKLGGGATNQTAPFHWPGGVGWATLGLIVLVSGVLAIIAAVVWLSRSSRVSMAYLMSGVGWGIRTRIETSMPYLLCGHADLADFVNEYRRVANGEESARAEQMEAARYAILETASAERLQDLLSSTIVLFVIGGLAAALGGAMLIGNVNAANAQREDQLAAATQLSTGDLLPRTPTSVVLVIPTSTGAGNVWVQALSEDCVWQPSAANPPTKVSRLVPATLLDVGQPSGDAPGSDDKSAIYRVATTKTSECPNVTDGWVNPSWVALPPATGDGAQGISTSSASSTASPSSS
jgi:hypothetical protein